MSVSLISILQRLLQENLHGPTSPKQQNLTDGLGLGLGLLRGNQQQHQEQDLDSRDPRWFELFLEFFIDANHEVTDDILFFVRQFVPASKSSTGSINDLDPVFVRRRVAGQTPMLNDVIDWKQSFFLNLICQLPCTLTVAVCKKAEESGLFLDRDVTDLNPSSSSKPKGGGMIAKKRITNKVYASPYKSRMDVKDATMNECSFPLVFYSINDYQNENLHLSITSGEYLCAELSLTVPKVPSSDAYTRATSLVSEISLEQDTDPFPLPEGYSKIVLFQGAVGFKALSDVYQQKGVAALTQIRSGWGQASSPPPATLSPRTEYVLMRGPHGKGQCQVSIEQPNAPPLIAPTNTVLGFLKDTIKYQLGSPDQEKSLVPAPDELNCSLTYVNVAWQSISTDLLSFKF